MNKFISNFDFLWVFIIPEYALPLLIGNDFDERGKSFDKLNIDDLWNISEFNKKYNNPLVEISKHSEAYFSYNPEFGLPCVCVECNVFVS